MGEREVQIIEYRFGLLDGHPRTLAEVASEFHITTKKVKEIESIAFSLVEKRFPGELEATMGRLTETKSLSQRETGLPSAKVFIHLQELLEVTLPGLRELQEQG